MTISALNFSERMAQGFGFGCSEERAAAELRSLADKVESKDVLIQSVRVTSLASGEEFTLTGLRFVIAEKIDQPFHVVITGSDLGDKSYADAN